MSTQENLITARDLKVQYGTVPALDCPELHVPSGAIVTVIGANGAGKSTLLNAMMGNLPVNGFSRGQVAYRGQEVSSWTVEQRDRKSTRLNSSHVAIAYAVLCRTKKKDAQS